VTVGPRQSSQVQPGRVHKDLGGPCVSTIYTPRIEKLHREHRIHTEYPEEVATVRDCGALRTVMQIARWPPSRSRVGTPLHPAVTDAAETKDIAAMSTHQPARSSHDVIRKKLPRTEVQAVIVTICRVSSCVNPAVPEYYTDKSVITNKPQTVIVESRAAIGR